MPLMTLWLVLVGEPGLLLMFESSVFLKLPVCTPLERLLWLLLGKKVCGTYVTGTGCPRKCTLLFCLALFCLAL